MDVEFSEWLESSYVCACFVNCSFGGLAVVMEKTCVVVDFGWLPVSENHVDIVFSIKLTILV